MATVRRRSSPNLTGGCRPIAPHLLLSCAALRVAHMAAADGCWALLPKWAWRLFGLCTQSVIISIASGVAIHTHIAHCTSP